MMIRMAQVADAPAMGRVMVQTFLAAHREHMPAGAWEQRAREWTPEVSADSWARTLRAMAPGERPHECIYVAEAEDGDIVGLAMGSEESPDGVPRTGEVVAVYVRRSHQQRGLGRRLLQAVAADLAQYDVVALRVACLAANAPARRFYEAAGGRAVAERLFDEEGTLLPEVVYEWADITTLAAG
jgi:ribosomal protein S18 acetylase RimI-like enzyme